jgi:hypothetical protein
MILSLLLSVGLMIQPLCPGFFPANTLAVNDLEVTGLSEHSFDQTVDEMVKAWRPVVEAHGKSLIINRLWSNSTINSDTIEIGSIWEINAYGGLARFPGMTSDGYLLVLCHELGHHLGGAPLYAGADWEASVEGQADYYSTMKCLKPMWGASASARIKKASIALATVLAKLERSRVMPKPETPDKHVVTETYENHPAAQCRLDTYLAGLACNAEGEFSPKDQTVGACNSGKGARPRCWFKP